MLSNPYESDTMITVNDPMYIKSKKGFYAGCIHKFTRLDDEITVYMWGVDHESAKKNLDREINFIENTRPSRLLRESLCDHGDEVSITLHNHRHEFIYRFLEQND